MNEEPLTGEYAGFVTRSAAFFIDVAIISLTLIVFNLLVQASLQQFLGINLRTCSSTGGNWWNNICNWITIGLALISALSAPLYTLFFWLINGQTLGKMVMGLRVVRLDGKRLNLLTSLLRLAGFGLGFLSLGLGFLNVLINDRRQAWHDRLAGTCVIYAWEASENTNLIHRLQQRLQVYRLRAKTLHLKSSSSDPADPNLPV